MNNHFDQGQEAGGNGQTYQPQDPILRRVDAARELGIKPGTLSKWVADGIIERPIKIGPRAVGWLQSTVLAFKEERIEMSSVSNDALAYTQQIVDRWLPENKRKDGWLYAVDPSGFSGKKHSVMVSIAQGVWSFTGEQTKPSSYDSGGKELVSMVSYIDDVNEKEACKRLKEFIAGLKKGE